MSKEMIYLVIWMVSFCGSINMLMWIDKQNGYKRDKMDIILAMIPVLNSIYALYFAGMLIYIHGFGADLNVKLWFVKRINNWIVAKYWKIQKRIIRYQGFEKWQENINQNIIKLKP